MRLAAEMTVFDYMDLSEALPGAHCCSECVNHITLLPSKKSLLLKHIWLQGFWRMGFGSVLLYIHPGVMPEI